MKPRNPWLAALLNLLVSGLGYLYAGRARRAGCLVGLWLLLYFVAGFSGMLATLPGFYAAGGLLLALKLYMVADIFYLARKDPAAPPRAYMKLYVYAAYVAVILCCP